MVRVRPREHQLTREPCASSCVVLQAGFIASSPQRWKTLGLNELFVLKVVSYFMLQMGQKNWKKKIHAFFDTFFKKKLNEYFILKWRFEPRYIWLSRLIQWWLWQSNRSLPSYIFCTMILHDWLLGGSFFCFVLHFHGGHCGFVWLGF